MRPAPGLASTSTARTTSPAGSCVSALGCASSMLRAKGEAPASVTTTCTGAPGFSRLESASPTQTARASLRGAWDRSAVEGTAHDLDAALRGEDPAGLPGAAMRHLGVEEAVSGASGGRYAHARGPHDIAHRISLHELGQRAKVLHGETGESLCDAAERSGAKRLLGGEVVLFGGVGLQIVQRR